MTQDKENRELEAFAENLMRQVEAEGLLLAPVHMKQEILERSRRIDMQLKAETNQASKKVQLLFYSLKIGAAMVTALFLIFAIPRELPREPVALEERIWREEAVLEMYTGQKTWWTQELNEKLNASLRQLNQILTHVTKQEETN